MTLAARLGRPRRVRYSLHGQAPQALARPEPARQLTVDMTIGEVPNDSPKGPDSPAIQARRKGELRGGKARAKALSPRKRKVIARRAARARWHK